MCAKPLRVRFDKVEGFFFFYQGDGITKVYDGTKYLVLFCTERYDAIYDKIRVKKVDIQY